MKATFVRTCLLCSDYIVIGSDSGRILILEYNGQKNTLEKARSVEYFARKYREYDLQLGTSRNVR